MVHFLDEKGKMFFVFIDELQKKIIFLPGCEKNL